MSYTKTTPLNQGATKLSEIAVDKSQALHSSPIHASALPLIEQMIKTSADLLRRQNYFLKSEGKVIWNGTQIRLDESAVVNNMVFDILQTEIPSQPKISLRMNGTLGAPTATTFNDIPMADGDLLYLELDPAVILGAGTDIIIENGVNGGSTVSGKTLRKTTLAAGMPQISSAVPQESGPTPSSTTFYLPLCYINGTDIQWVPHGITWPAGTSSILGAIIVDGFQALPERFVGSESQFASALNDMLGLGGGIVLLTDSFGISQSYTIPPNTKVLGRGRKIQITVSQPYQIIMSENAEIQDFSIVCAADYQTNAVVMNGKRAKVRNIVFDITAPADLGPPIISSFTSNASDTFKFSSYARGVAVQSDGKVLIGGDFLNYAGQNVRDRLIRFNADGTEDLIFSANAVHNGGVTPKFNNNVYSIAVQSDGKIIVVGQFTAYAGQTGKDYVIRLNPDGTEDTAFSTAAVVSGTTPKFNNIVSDVKIQSDGKILLAGSFQNYAGQTGKSYLIRLNSDGTEDTVFSTNAVVSGTTPKFNINVTEIAIQTDGKIIVVGAFQNYAGQTGKNGLLRFNADGTEDTAFSANATVNGTTPRFSVGPISVTIQTDGKIVVAGAFQNYSGQTGKNRLLRLNPDGTEDTAFSTNAVVNGTTPRFSSFLYSVSSYSDGKVIVAGNFTNYNAQTGKNYVIRFNADGTEDTVFSNLAVVNGTTPRINSFAFDVFVLPDQRVLISGDFTNYIYSTRNKIALFNPDGTPEVQAGIGPQPPNATGIIVQASHCRIYEAWFLGTAAAAHKTAINFSSGTDNAAVDCLFE